MDYELLKRRCEANIEDSLQIIHKHRENIIRLEKEIVQLEKDRQKAKTTSVELGFEGNGVNCGETE